MPNAAYLAILVAICALVWALRNPAKAGATAVAAGCIAVAFTTLLTPAFKATAAIHDYAVHAGLAVLALSTSAHAFLSWAIVIAAACLALAALGALPKPILDERAAAARRKPIVNGARASLPR